MSYHPLSPWSSLPRSDCPSGPSRRAAAGPRSWLPRRGQPRGAWLRRAGRSRWRPRCCAFRPFPSGWRIQRELSNPPCCVRGAGSAVAGPRRYRRLEARSHHDGCDRGMDAARHSEPLAESRDGDAGRYWPARSRRVPAGRAARSGVAAVRQDARARPPVDGRDRRAVIARRGGDVAGSRWRPGGVPDTPARSHRGARPHRPSGECPPVAAFTTRIEYPIFPGR